MGIDRKVEQATRTMLGHAIRHELDDLAALMQAVGNDTLLRGISLCLVASAYVAIEASQRWPTDEDLRDTAKLAWLQAATELDISEQQIHEYLSRLALGSERPADVFPEPALVTIPLYATATLLLAFRPRDKQWWEYLDQIWKATEAADRTSLTVLPALMSRAYRESAAQRAQSPFM
jgi:hypothetical protein